MRIMLETTEWVGNFPNHVYVFNDSMSHMIAYVPAGSKQLQRFKKPIAFDRRGRTFVELEDQMQEEPKKNQWEFQGSKGDVYYVTIEAGHYQCTCPGFVYRNRCRHVAEMIQQTSYDVR